MKPIDLSFEWYKKWLFFVFVFAIVLRIFFFFQNYSLWADEALLALNIIPKSYSQLLKGLEHLQASPVGFIFSVKLLLNIFNPQNEYFRDLVLRIVPFGVGVLSLPLFYRLLCLISENLRFRFVAFTVFALNPLNINYCLQLKQYSMELFVTVLLMLIFYNILFKGIKKNYFSLVLILIPWFSFSAVFILVPYISLYLYKNFKEAVRFILPLIVSSLFYYVISFKYVLESTSSAMVDFWNNTYCFLSLEHPLRFILRLGGIFVDTPSKLINVIAGLLIFYFFVVFLLKKQEKFWQSKLFYFAPLLLAIIASLLQKYPFAARLLLFLLPYFCIYIAILTDKFSKILQKLFIVLLVITMPAYAKYYSYEREVSDYISKNYNPEYKILVDEYHEFYFYIKDKIHNPTIISTPISCQKRDGLEECKRFFDQDLKSGKYYYVPLIYTPNKMGQKYNGSVQVLPIKFRKKDSPAVYFEKE